MSIIELAVIYIIAYLLLALFFILCKHLVAYNRVIKTEYQLLKLTKLDYILWILVCLLPVFNILSVVIVLFFLLLLVLENEKSDIVILKWKF
jgi:hypothetical protein